MATPVNVNHSINFNNNINHGQDDLNKSLNLEEFNYTPSVKPEKSNQSINEDMSDLVSGMNSVDFKKDISIAYSYMSADKRPNYIRRNASATNFAKYKAPRKRSMDYFALSGKQLDYGFKKRNSNMNMSAFKPLQSRTYSAYKAINLGEIVKRRRNKYQCCSEFTDLVDYLNSMDSVYRPPQSMISRLELWIKTQIKENEKMRDSVQSSRIKNDEQMKSILRHTEMSSQSYRTSISKVQELERKLNTLSKKVAYLERENILLKRENTLIKNDSSRMRSNVSSSRTNHYY